MRRIPGRRAAVLGASFDGAGFAVLAGTTVYVPVPFAGTITGWTMLADVSGSAVLDVWNDTYANYPPTVADTIAAAAKPTISSAVKGASTTLTGWATTVRAGDILAFHIDSAATITRLAVSLQFQVST